MTLRLLLSKAQTKFENHLNPHSVLSDEYPFARVSIFFLGFLHHSVLLKLATSRIRVNTSAAKVTFIQCTKKQRNMKIILTLSCWYSLESSCWALSDEYPFAMVSVISQLLVVISCWPSSKRVNIEGEMFFLI